MIKTYGVKGLMEWVALIKVGRANIQVPFTGGTKSGYGMTPATYTCKEKVFQTILENSDYFKRGKIYLVKEEEDPTERKKAAEEERGKRKEEREVLPDDGESKATSVQTVKVSDVDTARGYLMEHFGLAARNLRSKEAVLTQGRAHGVEFEGLS